MNWRKIELVIIATGLTLAAIIWASPLPAVFAQNTPWHKGDFYLLTFHASRQHYMQSELRSGWQVSSSIPVELETVTYGWFRDKPLTPGVPVFQLVDRVMPLLEETQVSDFSKSLLGFNFQTDGKLFAQASWDNKQPACHELDRLTWSLFRQGGFTEVRLNLSGQRPVFGTLNRPNGPIERITNWNIRGMAAGDIRLYPSQATDLGFPCSTVWWDLPRNSPEPFIERFEVRQGWALVAGKEFLSDGLTPDQYRLTFEPEGGVEQLLATPNSFQHPSQGFWDYSYINFPWPNFSPIPQTGRLKIQVGEKTHSVRVLIVDGLVTVIR